MNTPAVNAVVERCQALFDDLDFNAVKQWKAAAPGRKAIGYMPIYVPRELVHAAGMLPVGILGGGDQLEVIQGDAYYQSYICRIPRSTIELGLTGRLDCLDGMLFPSICDVIRNLSGMWQILFKDKYVRYFDVPQNYEDAIGGTFYIHELEILRKVSDGMTNAEIGYALGISAQTVKNHVTSILRKLAVNDRTQAVVTALKRGWLSIDDTNPTGRNGAGVASGSGMDQMR